MAAHLNAGRTGHAPGESELTMATLPATNRDHRPVRPAPVGDDGAREPRRASSPNGW